MQTQTPLSLALIPLCLLAGACRSSSDLGRVPTSIVDLYDQGSPDGVLEIELDRDGTLREIEVDIGPGELPPPVREAALARQPGGVITGAERELTSRGAAWEVKITHEGRRWEYVMDDAGRVLETEKELLPDEVPQAVSDAAEAAMPGGVVVSVEIVESAEHVEYHVKRLIDGATYKLVVAPNGRLIRKVREARAELEIPLRD